MADVKADTVSLVPGRRCGDCSLCCKLIRVDAFTKAPGIWCTHCAPGNGGCRIYDNRPAECRDFHCAWLASPSLGEEWRPSRCKLVLRVESEGALIAVHVDPSDPAAWRREPYFKTIRHLAITGAATNQQVIVYIGNRVIAIFPNKEIEVGTMNPGDHLVVREVGGPEGRDWVAFIEPAGRNPG
jgi:uncharacterized cysteine cluster protein YcgN (CxxCxxCC family)